MSMEVDLPASPATGQHAPKIQVNEEDEPKDKFCDANCPVTVQFNEVTMAAYKIRGGIERTPCTVSVCTTNKTTMVPHPYHARPDLAGGGLVVGVGPRVIC